MSSYCITFESPLSGFVYLKATGGRSRSLGRDRSPVAGIQSFESLPNYLAQVHFLQRFSPVAGIQLFETIVWPPQTDAAL